MWLSWPKFKFLCNLIGCDAQEEAEYTIYTIKMVKEWLHALHFQEQWGWHCADEIVTSIPTRLKPALEHFQNSN